MDQRQTVIRFSILGLIVLAIIITGVGIFTTISRQGKIAVTLEVLPEDAQITIDDQKNTSGTVYVTPGVHTFTAHKEGFADDTVTTTISDTANYIGLLPAPISEAAKAWQTDEIQLKREAIGGQMAAVKGQATRDLNKIINELPYTQINGPFQIDYGPEPSRTNGIFLLISYSTPIGRQAALKWIRDQGYKLSDIDIRYDEFQNPLTSEAQ